MKETSHSSRILDYLAWAEKNEPDISFRDDYRIAWITVRFAQRGYPSPFVLATQQVLGLHPDKVWSAIKERRRANSGPYYPIFYPNDAVSFVGDLLQAPPKKPSAKALPQMQHGPRKVSGS